MTYAREKFDNLQLRNDLMDIGDKLRRLRLIIDSDAVDNLVREAQQSLFEAQQLLEATFTKRR